jgi:hypothetical protein
LHGKQRNKRQRTDRCGDLLIIAAPCVLGTDGYREVIVQTDKSEGKDPIEKVAMVGTYLQKTKRQFDKTCNYMEYTGKEKK